MSRTSTEYMYRTCFTVTMEDSYESKIGHEDFDPKTVFREMATLANEPAESMSKHGALIGVKCRVH
jgi:hypothetical protein